MYGKQLWPVSEQFVFVPSNEKPQESDFGCAGHDVTHSTPIGHGLWCGVPDMHLRRVFPREQDKTWISISLSLALSLSIAPDLAFDLVPYLAFDLKSLTHTQIQTRHRRRHWHKHEHRHKNRHTNRHRHKHRHKHEHNNRHRHGHSHNHSNQRTPTKHKLNKLLTYDNKLLLSNVWKAVLTSFRAVCFCSLKRETTRCLLLFWTLLMTSTITWTCHSTS